MDINLSLFQKALEISTITLPLKNGKVKELNILRLDKIHNTISGNKWFKLKYNLLEAKKLDKSTILSFGGAYSNHLHALAYAGKLFKFKTIGIVRGEEVDNPTLADCKKWGMELHFISRLDYRKKTEESFLNELHTKFTNSFIIPEGGDNDLGQKGCEEILRNTKLEKYDILCCSIGTGTTIQGLATSFKKEIWGFAPFKNAHSLKEKLLNPIRNLNYIDEYHFGGFGKTPEALRSFVQEFKKSHDIELDKVYTAKMFYGLQEKLQSYAQLSEKKVLVIHTGGLQGNRSSNS